MAVSQFEISIVIPVYNGEEFLNDCLTSIFMNEFESFEVIVVNNGSTDNSLEILKQFDVKIINLNKNYGFSYAINRGIEKSQSEYILLLNCDLVIEEKYLEIMYKALKEQESNGVVACAGKMIQKNMQNKIYNAGDFIHVTGVGGMRGYGEPVKNYTKKEFIYGVCAGAALYKKSIFKKFSALDEDYFIYMEDVDLNMKINLHGYKIIYEPNAISYHVGSVVFGFFSDRFIFLSRRNELFNFIKNVPSILMIKHFFKIWQDHQYYIRRYFLSGQLKLYIKSIMSFFIKIFPMCRKRFLNMKKVKDIKRYEKCMRF